MLKFFLSSHWCNFVLHNGHSRVILGQKRNLKPRKMGEIWKIIYPTFSGKFTLLSDLIDISHLIVILVMVVCIWICWVSLYHLIVMLVMVVFHPVGRLDWWSNDATSIIVTWSEENKRGILFNRRLLFFNLYEGGGRSTSRASDLHLHMRPNKGSLHWKLVFIALLHADKQHKNSIYSYD